MGTVTARSGKQSRRWRAAFAAVAVLAPVLGLAVPAQAGPGDLDPAFGGGGIAVGPDGWVTALARQSDGKIVAGGTVPKAGTPNFDFRIARFNPGGTLDNSFGVNGVVTDDRTAIDRMQDLAIQGDGKIVAAGQMFANGGDMGITRYTSEGLPDPTFGAGGLVLGHFSPQAAGADAANAIAIQGDGKLVAGGYVSSSDGGRDFLLARFNANGALDLTFGGGDGAVTTDFAGGNGETVFDVAVLGDGKIVAAGCDGSGAGGTCGRFALARYDSDGTLDPSFDGDGKATGPLARGGRAMAVQADGKLVVAGDNGGTAGLPLTVVLARFHPGGTLDTSFDGDGVVDGHLGLPGDVGLQGDGKLVVAGARDGDFMVSRYNSDGSLDAGFGTGGVVVTDVGPNNNGSAAGVVVQPDAKIVVGGGSESKFTLARYDVAPGGGEVADLSVSAVDSPDPVGSGGTLTYTLGVANAGPASAYRVVASAVLPAGSALVSATPTQGYCAEAAGTLTCELNGLVSGASVGISVVVEPGPPGQASLAFSATTTSSDPNPANSSLTAATTVTPGAGSWASLPGLGGPQDGPAAVLDDGRVLVVGTGAAEIYDPATRTSAPTGAPGTARSNHTATTLADGRVLVAGGVSGTRLASAEIWDPATGAWAATGPMATGHSDHTAVRLDNGKVLVVGGMDLENTVCPGPTGVPNSAELFDPATGTWSSTGNLVVTRVLHTTTKLADGRVLAVGGYIPSVYNFACGVGMVQQIAPAELYDPAAGTWSLPADTAIRRFDHSATLLPDGAVLVMGGNPCNGTCPTTSVERYDPATGTWSSRAQLPRGRSAHTATVLANGTVLVAGGQGTPDATATPRYVRAATVYDPTGDTFAPAGLMATGRVGPAVALPRNRVLFLGGYNAAGALGSVELYRAVVPRVADFDGSATSDIAVFRPSNGTWYLRGQSPDSVAYGTNGDIDVPADYDGDGDADIAVFRPSGTWYFRGATPDAVAYGTAGDVPVPADYDGDGDADIAVFRPSNGTWYFRGATPDSVAYGTAGDVPVPADYDGDGDADIAVFRPSNGTWYLRGATPDSIAYGTAGDVAVPGDFDGDARDDIAVFRPSNGTWYLRGQSPDSVAYGTAGDVAVPGDFDGDARADIAVFRPSNGTWHLRGKSPDAVAYGTAGDAALASAASTRPPPPS